MKQEGCGCDFSAYRATGQVSYSAEFKTVDLIGDSCSETRGVDAFALSLIKAERQIRRLFTHLVFQFPCFSDIDIRDLRETLGKNRMVYFEGFEQGFDVMYPRQIKDIVGCQYSRLRARIDNAIDCRNEIFHGQLTSKYLTREDLLAIVTDIRSWCEALAIGAESEIGYDGFARDSFQKSKVSDLPKRFKVEFIDVHGYAKFIRENMER
jgi:hypothetical protein